MLRKLLNLYVSDCRGFIAIALISLIAIGITFYLTDEEEQTTKITLSERENYKKLIKEIESQDTHKHKANENKIARLFSFNPNTADSSQLVSLGLKPWQARNVVKYRQKGGHFRQATDFEKIYGLTKKEFTRLLPYISIPEEKTVTDKSEPRQHEKKYVSDKFQNIVILDINKADTSVLKRIPGIGSYYAKQICSYREQLGGYIAISQLDEIENLPEGIEKWFTIEPTKPRPLDINRSNFKTLVHHPYLSYKQVCAIANLKRKYGKIKSIHELGMLLEFTQKDIERLSPYLTFE